MINTYCLKIKKANKNKRGLTKRENISPRDQQHKSSGSCPPHNHLYCRTADSGINHRSCTFVSCCSKAPQVGWLQ